MSVCVQTDGQLREIRGVNVPKECAEYLVWIMRSEDQAFQVREYHPRGYLGIQEGNVGRNEAGREFELDAGYFTAGG